ncbi:MAG: AAA family ATPase [Synechococcus sp. SB0678_bin_12]|nr:AAA family ATPase [Gammaproteobacteria bacterium]MYF35852.1 AAA family ATPase [Synechococcus sp. SB0678_bin_12]
MISSNGFAPNAIKHARESGENPRAPVVSLYTANEYYIKEDYLHPRSSISLKRDNFTNKPLISMLADHQSNTHRKALRRYYFGIFTNKGGTGKTTVAVHLAGAFALMGYNVILLDIDPQRNLKKLFQNDEDQAGLHVPPLRPGQMGCGVYVLENEEWETDKYQYDDVSIIICDCNPTLEENPNNLVQEFDYCIVPTTLNPLGIAKNSNVIKRTFEKIRTENSKAQMHVLINHYIEQKAKEKRNNLLLNLLKEQIDFHEDKKSYLIESNVCAIHRSDSLYYWSMYIVEKKEPQLAFELHGGKCVPGDDFLKLAEYFRGRFEEPQ